MANVEANELHEVVTGWSFLCWGCSNKSFKIIEESSPLESGSYGNGETVYVKVRVLACDYCSKPTILGTNLYYSNEAGWAARGEVLPSHIAQMLSRMDVTHWNDNSNHHVPQEYVAFIEPGRQRPMPKGISKIIKEAFQEAEKAVDRNMPISAAASIRTTIRLLVESHDIDEPLLKEAVRLLPFDKEYLDALSNMKLIGDHSLHQEVYAIEDLRNAVEVLHLSLTEYYAKKESLKKLAQAVGSKSSAIAKDKSAKTD